MHEPDQARRIDSQRGSAWSGVLLTVSVIVAIFVIVALFASSRRGTARRGWEATLGTAESVFARYPPREANESALEIERLAAELSVDLVPRGQSTRPRLIEQHRDRLGKREYGELGAWVDDLLSRESLSDDPPPRAAESFLTDQRPEIDAVREQLLRPEVPKWERRMTELLAAPVPNLMGLLELHKILVADAVRRMQLGHQAAAEANLQASWRLIDVLADDPMLISQLVAVGIAHRTSGALRLLDDVPPEWAERLEQHDFRTSSMDAMLFEHWVWTQYGESPVDVDSPLFAAALGRVVSPYYQLCLADVSERARRQLIRLQAADLPCDTDPARLGIDLTVKIPAWNVIGSWGNPDNGGVVARVQRLRINTELTRRVVELHAARRANDGQWPASLPGGERSDVCPRDRWIYAPGTGRPTLRLDRELNWSDEPRRVRIPLRWSAR